jgi:hypothetical protein
MSNSKILVDQAEKDRALRDALIRKAALARREPSEFFNLVIREEHGNRDHIKCAPHQKVIFSFVSFYDRCVVRLPPGYSKSYTMATMSMWLIGKDPTARGAIISATQEQAIKPVAMVRDYIGQPNEFPELQLVFPGLKPSKNLHDAWTQTKLVVDRPAGIRDPSLIAIGLNGALPGARLSWILVDDILTEENTRTDEGRKSVKRWFNTTVLSRRDVKNSKVVVTNTAWHPDDLTFALEKAGWPTLSMTASGDITLINAPEYDSPHIRPSKKPGEVYRLTAHDHPTYDEKEIVPLWPTRFSKEVLDEFRKSMPSFEYQQLFENKPRSETDSRCKREWIESCKSKARDRGYYTTVLSYNGSNPTFTGVDLGVGMEAKHGRTALFTFEILPDNMRRILNIESGHWQGPEIIQRISSVTSRFNSIARVENNAAQKFILDFALEQNASLLVESHHTGMNKLNSDYGIECLFVELENGAWLIPNMPNGDMTPEISEFVEACMAYNPKDHTADILMAAWLAREEARAVGFGSSAQTRHEEMNSVIGNLFMR